MRNEEVLQRLKAPATGLIIAGSLNGALALIALLSGLLRLSGITGQEKLPSDPAERMGFLGATVASYGIAFLTLMLAPLVIYGGIKMMAGKKYGLSRAAAIISIVPLTSCCFIVGIPLGIWALVVLAKPDVKALFNGEPYTGNFHPPQPPHDWQ
jgi:hypothetical protein